MTEYFSNKQQLTTTKNNISSIRNIPSSTDESYPLLYEEVRQDRKLFLIGKISSPKNESYSPYKKGCTRVGMFHI